MRNVNTCKEYPFPLQFLGFILTMRNVNYECDLGVKLSLSGFILTMRNVNAILIGVAYAGYQVLY